LAGSAEGCEAKVVGMLREVRAGGSRWNDAREVLEPQRQQTGNDYSFVFAGERVKEGCEALKLFVDLISFAGEEAMYELVSANRGPCGDEDRP
jgi:hypothetical protein